jgi:hypothetical protein
MRESTKLKIELRKIEIKALEEQRKVLAKKIWTLKNANNQLFFKYNLQFK